MDRDKKKQLKNQFKARERQAFVASYPVPADQLRQLCEHLDRKEAPPCDHTLRQTKSFLAAHKIDVETVVPWLLDHGAGCDCEVLLNIYEEVAEQEGWELDA